MDHAHLGPLPDGGDHDEVHDDGDDSQEHVHNDHQAPSLVRRPVPDEDVTCNESSTLTPRKLPVRPEIVGGQICDVLHGLCDVELEEEPVTHDDDPDTEMGPQRLRHADRLSEAEDRAGRKAAASMLPLLGWSVTSTNT